MAENTQRSQFLLQLLFVGALVLAVSVAGVDDCGSGCGDTCKCSDQLSCTSGSAKKNCCWSGGKCKKISALSYLTDRNNCGSCGISCSGNTQTCCGGKCLGPASYQSDPKNCGKCDVRCGSTQTFCEGLCLDVRDFEKGEENCGACSNSCSGKAPECWSAAAGNAEPKPRSSPTARTAAFPLLRVRVVLRHLCRQRQRKLRQVQRQVWRRENCCSNNCISTATDNHNCRGCRLACGSGKTCCGGVCADAKSFATDSKNCGKCKNQCSKGKSCCGGACKGSGEFKSDPKNCGRCGVVCGKDKPKCVDGACWGGIY